MFTWADLRDFIKFLPPNAESAVFRSSYPKSYWWTADHDFLSAILNALQWSNWQRGGGKGDKPKPVKRPKEDPKQGPKSLDELEARKQAVKKRRKAVADGD